MSLLFIMSAPAFAQSDVRNWGKADALGLAAWRVVVEEMPELAADAKKSRFDPRRDLRQITVDLNRDGRAEVFVSATVDSFCGSAGCMTFVLGRDVGGWRILCETYAHYGVRSGDVRLGPYSAAGWRDFTGAWPVTWVTGEDGYISCQRRAGR